METGRSTSKCCRRKAILLSMSDMSRSKTFTKRQYFESREVVGPSPAASRVDCGKWVSTSNFEIMCVVFISRQ